MDIYEIQAAQKRHREEGQWEGQRRDMPSSAVWSNEVGAKENRSVLGPCNGAKRLSPYANPSAKLRPPPHLGLSSPSPSPLAVTSTAASNHSPEEVEPILWVETESSTPRSLPRSLSWGDPRQMWNIMVAKGQDPAYARHNQIFGVRHPDISQPRSRAILIDWMLDVCEVYKLHRETFYLALDLMDRYLMACEDLKRDQLQLLGITTLFIASKLEEIYPPKCEDFAYTTDRACTQREIRSFEKTLLQKLKYRLSPVTPLQWLQTYLQLFFLEQGKPAPDGFPPARGVSAGLSDDPCDILKPQFDRQSFLALTKVLDLAIMQEESLGTDYATLAGGVVASLLTEANPVERVAEVCKLEAEKVRDCVAWLEASVSVLESAPAALPPEIRDGVRAGSRLRHFEDVHADDVHNIQTREVSLLLYEHVTARKQFTKLRSLPPHLQPFPSHHHQYYQEQGGHEPMDQSLEIIALHSPTLSSSLPTPPASLERRTSPPNHYYP